MENVERPNVNIDIEKGNHKDDIETSIASERATTTSTPALTLTLSQLGYLLWPLSL